MPYINSKDSRRVKLQGGDIALTAGELNYQIFFYYKYRCRICNEVDFEIIKEYVEQFLGTKPNYQKYNDMTGCLIRCYKEIKRRLGINAKTLIKVMDNYDEKMAKYEDKKIIENGDV